MPLLLAWLIGCGVAVLTMEVAVRRLLRSARRNAAANRDGAQAAATAMMDEARGRAEALRRRLRRQFEAAHARKAQDLDDYAADLEQREALLNAREADLGALEGELAGQKRRLAAMHAELGRLDAATTESGERLLAALSVQASLSCQEAVQAVVTERVERHRFDVQLRTRRQQDALREAAAASARRVMSTAVDRYNGIGHLERMQNCVALGDNPTLRALADPDGAWGRRFTEAVGCELHPDATGQSLTVRGDAPLAREMARRVLRQVEAQPLADVDALAPLVRDVHQAVEEEVGRAGRRAMALLRLEPGHPDVVRLVGSLTYRLSYSQNQWKHAVEVAYLAGMIASELGISPVQARRGGLLHDIGKAMTHDHEGSHAVLGAQVARRCGEEEAVANAIGAHHNDEPPAGPLAYIVAAADAISGARPGARREAVTQYLTRIQDIQRIAHQSAAVRRVDIMQAGREVRVVVAGEARGEVDPAERSRGPFLSDAELHPLAQEIARQLEEEVTFPGQIRVTVIRESRAVTTAR